METQPSCRTDPKTHRFPGKVCNLPWPCITNCGISQGEHESVSPRRPLDLQFCLYWVGLKTGEPIDSESRSFEPHCLLGGLGFLGYSLNSGINPNIGTYRLSTFRSSPRYVHLRAPFQCPRRNPVFVLKLLRAWPRL